MLRRTEGLPELRKTLKATAVLWCVQGDAAAKVGAEVDGGGGAPKTGRHEEEEAEGHEGGKRNDPSVLFIRQGTCVRRENQGIVGLEMKLSPQLSQTY